MLRAVRLILPVAALVLLGTFAPPALQRREAPPAVTLVSFSPVPLDEKDPGARRLGRLLFLGGWAVASNDPRLGGISALHVTGGDVLAVSDAGWWIRFPLPGGAAPARASIARINEGPGPSGDKEDRDAESLAVAGAVLWLGYERANSVWRYDRSRLVARASAAPPAMAKWSDNRGPEAMVRLADGRFLIFSEGGGGDSTALLFAGDPAVPGTPSRRLVYRPPAGYRVTDSALLPDGRIILLNRRVRLFEGFSAKLTLLRLPALLREGAVLAGDEIASFEGEVTRDNLEALSVVREGARTILWIASDDNYNPLQRTLLLRFALE